MKELAQIIILERCAKCPNFGCEVCNNFFNYDEDECPALDSKDGCCLNFRPICFGCVYAVQVEAALNI